MRILALLFYAALAVYLLRALVRWLARAAKERAREGEQLVRDERCGVYVPRTQAAARRSAAGGTLYFCGEECAAAYDAERRG